jgi:hypothetical protein
MRRQEGADHKGSGKKSSAQGKENDGYDKSDSQYQLVPQVGVKKHSPIQSPPAQARNDLAIERERHAFVETNEEFHQRRRSRFRRCVYRE